MKIIFPLSLALGGIFLQTQFVIAASFENPSSLIHLTRGEGPRPGHHRGGHHIEGRRMEGRPAEGRPVGGGPVEGSHRGEGPGGNGREFRDRGVYQGYIPWYGDGYGYDGFHENVYEYEGIGAGVGVGLDSPGVGETEELCYSGYYDAEGNFICTDANE
jgi:hypothetical protein